ncbi:PRC-barrel domain-containing protein [Salinarimonas sp. NSM]|uniref:PRC-barrel domain-containing protein n=1 Tax=Salinarimonas sp. NSM TaxID=3458003 RepID=UPI004035BE45
MLTRTSTIALLAAIAAAPAMAQDASVAPTTEGVAPGGTLAAQNIVAMDDWRYDEIYAGGMSAEEFIDEYEVYGAAGEEIGDVEDVIVGADGRILAVVAEIGGFIDIGDTHVAVPWDEVEMAVGEQAITIPVTEDTIDDYGVFGTGYYGDDYGVGGDVAATGAVVEQEVVTGLDDAELGPRAYRVSEIIGDYARIRGDDDTPRNYGYVNDVILSEGRVQAVVVSADTAYGRGAYAYPYYGPYGYAGGWGTSYGYGTGAYYDLPYGESEIGGAEPFEYERLGGDM